LPEDLKFTKVQELIYDLTIERVMTKNLITVSPDTSMGELKEILRINRISGVPVLESGRLVGIISIEDLIKALENGDIHTKVGNRMTTRLITIRQNESIVEAVKKFALHQVGRLLVVDDKGQIAGILTSGDITRGLLEAISLDYHAEEINRYRARYIFEDISSDETRLILRYHVKPKDFEHGGKAASKLKHTLRHLGAFSEIIRRVAISAYEAEMNLIIHSDHGGDLLVEISSGAIRITVMDDGPGIPNIEEAMRPGFSTAPHWIQELGFGAGMGLNNIQKCANSMNLESKPGEGTRLTFLFHLPNEKLNQEPL
jgi:CBS domain-containing protein/anti-sigma regulatory factor (Ser/Thr protein kinase)